MKEALPFGEIRPGARSVSQFVNPVQQQTASAARPSLLPNVKGMVTQQMAGTSSVQGYNQLAQVAEALGPLNSGLAKAAQRFVVNRAKNNIEEGYYEQQALQNQTELALYNLQQQQEQGSSLAAAQITQLEGTDPAAAAMLRESNPWKAIGRRRLMAQMAAGDIDNALQADLLNNAGALSTYKPGSPELMRRKTMLTQQVLDEYGLTGSEPEASYYVTPKLNKAWDKYTEKQGEYYTAELRESTIQSTIAAMGTRVTTMITNGVELPDGTKITMGDPLFGVIGGGMLTQMLDADIAQLAGQDKADALKRIREQLVPMFGSLPGGWNLLSNIRGGRARDDRGNIVSMEKRPRWIDSMPYLMLDQSVKGTELRTRQFEAQQETLGRNAKVDYQTNVAPLDSRTEEYRAALEQFRRDNAGWVGIDDYIKGREQDQEAVDTATDASPTADVEFLRNSLTTLPPDAFKPENRETLGDYVDTIVQGTPGTREEKQELRRDLWKTINDREKELAKLPSGTQSKINSQVRIALADPAIMKLDEGKRVAGVLNGVIPGLTVEQAVAGSGNPRYQEYYAGLKAMMTTQTAGIISQWYRDNPGAAIIPESEVQAAVVQAYSEVMVSEGHRQLYERATGKSQQQQERPVSEQTTAPSAQLEPPEAWGDVPKSEAQQFQNKPILDQAGLYKELEALNNNRPVSRGLEQLARKAGTNVYELLGKQVELYVDQNGKNTLDPDGSIRRYLQGRSKKAKADGTVAQTLYPSLAGTGLGMIAPVNPYAPGSWLQRMMGIVGGPQPPAAAAPTQQPRPATGGTYAAGSTLTQDQIEDVLAQAGWPERMIPTMAAVAMGESTGRSGEVNNNPATGDNSYGLLQINMIGDIGPYRMQRYGLKSYDDLKDPLTNARVALDIYRTEGIQAWGAYRDGNYRRFMR